jgi:hypothetical protein
MTSPLKVAESHGAMLELCREKHLDKELEANYSCDPEKRQKFLFSKKIFLIKKFDSMRNNVDRRCQSISDKRLKDTHRYLYKNYFKCILRLPVPMFDMKKIYAYQQCMIDQINSCQKIHATSNKEPYLLEFCLEIEERLKYFSKYFYAIGFNDLDMDVKRLRAFSAHMRFYPEMLDEAL